MNWLSCFVGEKSSTPLFDNTKRIARIGYRARYYRKVGMSAVQHIPMTTLLRSHFTFLLPEYSRPAHLTIELTNNCNLKCPYCTSPMNIRTKGYMSQETFALLVKQIKDFGIHRVRVVGNGEPTLHPKFPAMIRELGQTCSYLTMVTNGQRLREPVMRAIFEAPVRLLEISADSNEKEGYEETRIGGTFERLLENLTQLRAMRGEMGASTIINIRAMIRPSQLARQDEIIRYWSAYADTVMPQYLNDGTQGNFADVFPHRQAEGMVPRCGIPSRAMLVHYNGKVPLCELSQRQTGMEDGLIVGNIHENSLQEIWNASLFQQYREGHRKRDCGMTPICTGCIGG